MKRILMAAAAITLMMMMTVFSSCADDDNGSGSSGATTAVDNGTWPVPAEAMDSSYLPGNDFFMYCNGGFWKNTTVDESKAENNCWVFNEVKQLMADRVAAITVPSLVKMKADVVRRDTATLQAQQQRIQSAIDRIEAVQTLEEAWTLTGQLLREGYRLPLDISVCSKNGRIVAYIHFWYHDDFKSLSLVDERQKLSWRVMHNARMLSCIKPLVGDATRSIDAEKWPMLKAIFQGAGIPLDDACVVEDISGLNPEGVKKVTDGLMNLQNFSLEDYKNDMLLGTLDFDEALFSDEALNDINEREGTSLTRNDMIENFANKYLMYERSKAFADAYITAEMKQRTLNFSEELRTTFRNRINASTWMSDGSKRNAIEKLDAMIFNVGYPEKWMQEGLPDLSSQTTLLDDVMAVRAERLTFMRALLGKSRTEASFHMSIAFDRDYTIINAFYTPNLNAMNIWPVWIMEPYYNAENNEAFNYATLMVFGHEITHGFDTNGATFNKLGDPGDIWANDADRQEFQRRAQQLIDCYNGYEVMPWALPGLYADGAYTVTENIADLGGFLMAYDTYLRHLREQGFSGEEYDLQRRRFYLSLAWLWHGKYTAKFAEMYINGLDENKTGKNIHSLFRERVNGIVSNTDDWYDLFDVKEGDKLYRSLENRVRIW